MSNPFNNGTIVGNAARAPKLFEHANGGATVKLSVYARNTFKNKATGKVESEIVELTGYVQDAKNPGVFGCIGSGDRVAVSYSLKTDVYTDKEGQKQYPLVARIDTVQPTVEMWSGRGGCWSPRPGWTKRTRTTGVIAEGRSPYAAPIAVPICPVHL